MPVASRLYVDANIFIYAFEGNGDLGAALIRLLTIEGKVAPFLVTSELTLAEVLVAPYRNRDNRLIDLYDRWTVPSPRLTVDPVSRPVLWYAAVLRSQYTSLRLPDAIHLSTAMLMNCSHFLTGDTRLSSKYELLHHRYGIQKGPLSIEVMRPQPDLVQQLIEDASR
jgi:predicted nucleic acid-binding protein